MMRNELDQYWTALADLARRVPIALLERAADLLFECYERDCTIFVAGNGGSAATASHFVCDLAKGARRDGSRPFRVIPLTDNIPLMTAWANDVSYDRVFAEQLETLGRRGDVLVVISVSGGSPNIVAAAESARLLGMTTIALTGRTGGTVRRFADLTVPAPADSFELVEDLQLAMTHSLCVALRARLQTDLGVREETHGPVHDAVVVDVVG